MDPYHPEFAYHLKIWLDNYDYIVETKHGSRCVRNPEATFVTSQYTIKECFKDS